MIDHAQADFTQQVKFGFSGIEQTFSGSLLMEKPRKYRIESEQQTLVTDGVTVWAYSPVNRQVIVDHFRENQNSVSPERFLFQMPDDYYMAVVGTETEHRVTRIILKLVPKDDRSFLRSVRVWVDQDDGSVRKVQLLDVNDTETTYTLTNLRLNAGIRPDAFSFVPPPGTEIVDLR